MYLKGLLRWPAPLTLVILAAAASPALGESTAAPAAGSAQITVLYDAFGPASTLRKDWGFSAFIEYGGMRILFDTGNNADILAHNFKEKGIDITTLDFAVVSHRHCDHSSGVSYLLKVNPDVKIYVPQENFGLFGAALPGTFYKRDATLPAEMRYFDGKPPEHLRFGTPWPAGEFVWVTKTSRPTLASRSSTPSTSTTTGATARRWPTDRCAPCSAARPALRDCSTETARRGGGKAVERRQLDLGRRTALTLPLPAPPQ